MVVFVISDARSTLPYHVCFTCDYDIHFLMQNNISLMDGAEVYAELSCSIYINLETY